MTPYFFHDPFDPMGGYYYLLPKDTTPEQLKEYQRITLKYLWRTVVTALVMISAFAVLSLFTSCTTAKTANSEATDHLVSDMLQRMDSLMASHTVIQQDSAWRETILKQFESIREKSDTSHSVTLSATGDTIREKIIIKKVRETTSETDRQEREVLMHRLDVHDSTINLMRLQMAHSDSLLQQKQTEIEKAVEKQLNWFQQMRLWLGNIVLIALAVAAGWLIIKKKAWWLALLRKIV